MSTISKSGIAPGQIIKSEHLLRVIEALSGDTINDIVVTGSLQATDGHITHDLRVDGTLFATASYTQDSSSFAITSSYALTASYAANAVISGSNTVVGNTVLSGSLDVSGSTNFHNSVFIVTGSQFFSGSSQFIGNQQLTGSLKVSGSIYAVGSYYLNGNKLFNYGAFSDLTTQSGSANVSESFKFNTTDVPDGVYVINDSRGFPTGLEVAYTGIYNLQFSAQIQQGASSADLAIWFRKNNVNIPNSATYLTIPSNQKAVAAWNIVVPCNAGDHLEITYQSNSSATTYPYIAASGNVPAVPSIIATVTQIA